MSWRPEEWSNILRAKAEKWNKNPPEWTFDNFIEFGADAMLEALRGKGQPIEYSPNWRYEDYANEAILALDRMGINKLCKFARGKLVFIPDEKGEA